MAASWADTKRILGLIEVSREVRSSIESERPRDVDARGVPGARRGVVDEVGPASAELLVLEDLKWKEERPTALEAAVSEK